MIDVMFGHENANAWCWMLRQENKMTRGWSHLLRQMIQLIQVKNCPPEINPVLSLYNLQIPPC